ncbi:MAG: S49 family peptidase [Rickettsiales bacterium]|nr:S49 family peptidase [Pseudomonadota bacterium]MDA0966295.1 S49 family peptidase [Pseudomonadota bacterium]MDG4543040.1 S49 family peptidase [Rickettsiales bacterium]MDG4545238.1 S49 family peptidase [Rickettsiales bacterium]MDG4547687.1 S49 family peptidase [Rickettsiales bacterium]
MPAKKQNKLKKLLANLRKPKPTVAVLRLSGVIGTVGMAKKGLSLDELNEEIEKAFELSGLKAVALQINSPGGSPVQSELIYKRIRMLSEEKKIPVYSFVEDVAASGGYWLACTGDEIYASESSIVGSIGVISSGFGFVEAIKKLGIERRVYTQGENKSILDPFQKENPNDIEILNNLQKDVHESFKNLVRTRREGKIKKTNEKKLFSGEFWNGVKGKELGLIDDIGDMHSVITEKYGKKIKFEKISKPQGWLKKKLTGASLSVTDGITSSIAEKIIWNRFGH